MGKITSVWPRMHTGNCRGLAVGKEQSVLYKQGRRCVIARWPRPRAPVTRHMSALVRNCRQRPGTFTPAITAIPLYNFNKWRKSCMGVTSGVFISLALTDLRCCLSPDRRLFVRLPELAWHIQHPDQPRDFVDVIPAV